MIAVVGVIVLITILTWVVVAQALFMGNYQQLERNDVQSALGATRYSLELSVGEMNQTARDYASWDDTYSFVENNNSSYITDNLVESTFQNLRLNLLFIENTDGQIVVAKAYDLVNGSFVALPSELDRLASTDSPLFFHNESTGTSTGILSTANGSLLVASQPILTSEGAGPIHGTLVFGRYLTPDVLTAIAGPGKTVSAYPFGAQSLEKVQRVQPALAEGASSVIEPVNATTVAGFTLLRDIYGNPSLVLEEVLPRTIYEAGLSSTNTFLGLLVISGVISLTCMIWSLRQSVLAPLLRINTSLARIRTSDDLSKRVPERGDVELVWLAHAINATLASLESSHAERDAAADELLESEEMLRLVLNASEDAISLVDTNEVFLTANEALAHRLGVPAAEVIGMKGFTEKPEDIAKQRRARFARAIATKLPVHFDDEHAGRQLENVYQPLVDARGNVTKVAVFSRDITERKRAEAALIMSERRTRELTDALPVVVYETDATGRATFVNAMVFDMFGYTKEEFEGMSIFQVATDAEKERGRTASRRRMDGEDVGRVEYTGQRKDGSTFPVSALGAPIRRDGAVVGVRGIVVDITEQKRAEERMKEHTHTIEILNRIMTEGNRAASVQSFAETVTNLTLELLHFDAGTIHLADYDARCAKLRYVTGLPDTAVEAIREIPLTEPPYAGFLVEPKPLFLDGHEMSRVPHVAELGITSLAVVPLYRYDEIIGALNVGSFKHHTFSQAEKELLIAIGNEAGVVIAKLQTDELIRAALKERETLLKEIHHRVKNNLQIVSSLLSLQATEATEPETIEMLNESQRRIRSMALIHEKLYRSGSLAEINFADYVESLIDELLRMYNVAEGVITLTADIENVQLGVDTAIPCALIINELVSNSLKHAFPDGRTGEVTIAIHRINGRYELTITDNGVGPPPDFDFQKTDSLGLQLVTGLVNQLDGTITLDRTKGTTFIITFKPAGAHVREGGGE